MALPEMAAANAELLAHVARLPTDEVSAGALLSGIQDAPRLHNAQIDKLFENEAILHSKV
jgi:hypothetical protein